MADTLELLYTGDLHLGRHPSRIPADLDTGSGLSPKDVWRSTTQEAIERDVDAVVIAGDIVDQENRYFEAYGAFEDGVARLDEHGIPTVVVAGNHDYEAMPEMADNLDFETLHFLGRGQTWDRWTLKHNDEPVAHFDGWSFAAEHVYESPLETYDQSTKENVPQIGVLHADLDSRGSRYAPVLSSELQDTPADAWLLGHIHTPGVRIESNPLTLYSGSLQPLDPGEQRTHGPWTVTVSETGGVSAEQLPLASLRYDQVSVDVSEAATPQEATTTISDAIKEHVRSELDLRSLELTLVRVRLTGRTEAHAELLEQHQSMERDLGFREGSVSIRIESIEVDTRPTIDLEDLADGENAAAFLAEFLLELEEGDLEDTYSDVVEDALDAMRQAYSANAYNSLRRETELEDPTEEAAIEHLEREARRLLETLLSQKEGQI